MYKLILKLLNESTQFVQRIDDGACIPFADGNRDYEEYKQWLSEGNTPEPEFTEEELAQQTIDKAIAEARQYLSSTDFYFTVDKYSQLTEDKKAELTSKREDARNTIRGGN